MTRIPSLFDQPNSIHNLDKFMGKDHPIPPHTHLINALQSHAQIEIQR